MNDERQSLIAAICLQPAEDTPRLAFADWCDEHGDSERAEFVRKSIELESHCPESSGGSGGECPQCYHARLRLPTTNGPCRCTPDVRELKGRVSGLLRDNERRWLPPWWPDVESPRQVRPVWNPRWRRGFVDCVSVTTAALNAQVGVLFRECPLERVRVDNKYPHSTYSRDRNGPVDRWRWWRTTDRRNWSRPEFVASFLFDRMTRGELRQPDGVFFTVASRVYDTLQAAFDDLNAAALSFGRAMAFPELAEVG